MDTKGRHKTCANAKYEKAAIETTVFARGPSPSAERVNAISASGSCASGKVILERSLIITEGSFSDFVTVGQ
jgi:hypothetical protein